MSLNLDPVLSRVGSDPAAHDDLHRPQTALTLDGSRPEIVQPPSIRVAQNLTGPEAWGLGAALPPPHQVNRRPESEGGGRVSRALAGFAGEDFSIGDDGTEARFRIPRDDELRPEQRAYLEQNPGQTIVRTEIALGPEISSDSAGVRLALDGRFRLVVDVPIDQRGVGLDTLRARATRWVSHGIPNLDGETLSGDAWPVGSQLEVRGGLGVSAGDDVNARVGRGLLIRAARVSEDEVELSVGQTRHRSLDSRLSLGRVGLAGEAERERVYETTYRLDLDEPEHRAAASALLSLGRGLDTSYLDRLGGGHVRYGFGRRAEPSPSFSLPFSNLVLGAGLSRPRSVAESVRFPRTVGGHQLSPEELRTRVGELRAQNPDAYARAPIGTEIMTRDSIGFGWRFQIGATSSRDILDRYLTLGGRVSLGRQDEETTVLERHARWIDVDGTPRVELSYRGYDREDVRWQLQGRLGVSLGPAIRELYDEGFSGDDSIVDDFLSDPEATRERYGDAVFSFVESKVNNALDALSLRASVERDRSYFDGVRLDSIPLDLSNPYHARFFELAMSDAPPEAVLHEAAVLRRDHGIDVFSQQRFDQAEQSVEREVFQALALRMEWLERDRIEDQQLVFRDSSGEQVTLSGRQVGRWSERRGIFEDLRADIRGYTVTRGSELLDSGLAASFRLDDNRLRDSETQVVAMLPVLLGLGQFSSYGERRGSARVDAGISIGQEGLARALSDNDLPDLFFDTARRLRGLSPPFSEIASQGPYPMSFDPRAVSLAAGSSGPTSPNAQAFMAENPGADWDYTRRMARSSPHHLRWATNAAIRELDETRGPGHEAHRAGIRHDTGHTMLARFYYDYIVRSLSEEDRKDIAHDFRSLSRNLGRRDLSLSDYEELEERRDRLQAVFASAPFQRARARLNADQGLTLAELESLTGDGFRSILDESGLARTALGDNDFYALALWVTIARAAGQENVVAEVRGDFEGQPTIHLGDPIVTESTLDGLIDRVREGL